MDSRARPRSGAKPLAAHTSSPLLFIDSERWLGPLLIGPAVLYIVLLVGLPFFMALYYSVSNTTTGGGTLGFVGLRNFTNVVGTPKFQTALKNTLDIRPDFPSGDPGAQQRPGVDPAEEFRGKRLIRFLILLPWVAPISIGTIAWLWIFDSTYSVLNWTSACGIDPRTGLHVVGVATLGDGVRHSRSRVAPAPARHCHSAGGPQLDSQRYSRCGCGGWRRLSGGISFRSLCR